MNLCKKQKKKLSYNLQQEIKLKFLWISAYTYIQTSRFRNYLHFSYIYVEMA